MKVSLIERSGKFFLEGFADHGLLRDVADTTLLIEACFNHKTNSVLLYAENLTDHFFDISSQEAGAILQKVRNYGIRLAIVWSPDAQPVSSRFRELLVEEKRHGYFRLFEDRQTAETWLLER